MYSPRSGGRLGVVLRASRSKATVAPVEAAAVVFVDGERREPVKGVRKHMAEAMVRSAFTAPHVTEWVEVDVTRSVKLVRRLGRRRDLLRPGSSPLLLVARAALLGTSPYTGPQRVSSMPTPAKSSTATT